MGWSRINHVARRDSGSFRCGAIVKTGKCRCGSRIFFNNHRCLSCHAPLGRCTACGSLTSFLEDKPSWICDSCQCVVHACTNQSHGVCHSFNSLANTLCRFCEFTSLIPPLNQPESVRRWATMESAKRRLLLQLEELNLPPFIDGVQQSHPLSFEFLENSIDIQGQTTKVTTGHENGLITINLAEADSVHRERLRVELGEPHRTLIGHMRHEIGHYIDWSWASRVAYEQYQQLFGDPGAADYSEAMKRHYDQGPPSNWANSFVSAYATMHPWEDFAETVNAYLDIIAIATTAMELGRCEFDLSADANAEELVLSVLEIVIEVNEYNFDLGLKSLLPEQIPPAVLDKLAYVHALRNRKLSPTLQPES
ncbi:putative zinc-binding metallopeptidase [Novipirellula sp.]|uniref:putative zinc-binding metallopeptidase n=1 Tax=Novipirellula sp. TaxID=2795430 RepID=UPI00356B1469